MLNNALKFTKNGTVTINTGLNYSTNNHDKEVIVTIIDTGIGIPPEIVPGFFKVCYYIKSKCTGLGLFISKGIIEAHGGRIWAENNSAGIGATISFSCLLFNLN